MTQYANSLVRQKWGELYLQWSPLGTYLASLHRVGVALWSGPKLDGPIGVNILRFTHPGARLVQFSPCEKYLVTWSEEPLEDYENSPNPALRETFGPEDKGNQYVVWDIKETRVLRTFPAENPVATGDEPPRMNWPAFKWSPDDLYVARCIIGQAIQVYTLPDMGLLDKKSIKVEGVQDFEWCPMSEKDLEAKQNGKGRENMLVYWQPEVQNQPAKVNLMAIPSRNILRAKNLFNVTDVRHCAGFGRGGTDRHVVQVLLAEPGRLSLRQSRSTCQESQNQKGHVLQSRAFPSAGERLSDRGHRAQRRVRMSGKYESWLNRPSDYVPQFAWEPQGTRFAIVSTNDPNYGQSIPGVVVKYNIDFYQLDPKKGDFAPIRHFEGKMANTLVWSPKGRHIVFATIGSSSKYDIDFLDLDFTIDDNPIKRDAEPGSNVQLMNTAEHYGITDIAWDPSGRYLSTYASAWRQSVSHIWRLCPVEADDRCSPNLATKFSTLKAPSSSPTSRIDSSS